jgi:cell division transport system ATP-binding protein
MKPQILKFEKVTKIYFPKRKNQQKIVAIEDLSFSVEAGEFVILFGNSGAGKTTTFKLILREEKPTSGKIFLKEKELNSLSFREFSSLRRKIGIIFQDFRLLEEKTVIENLVFVLESLGFEEEIIQKDSLEVLEIVGLREKIQHFPEELSAGEKQRLAIARALVLRPELILADEPTASLDKNSKWNIISLLEEINKMGTSVILATHDEEIAKKIKKRKIILEKGRLIKEEI